MVDNTEEDQGVHHHLTGSYFLARHFVGLYRRPVFFSKFTKWEDDNKFCWRMRIQEMSIEMTFAITNIEWNDFRFKMEHITIYGLN